MKNQITNKSNLLINNLNNTTMNLLRLTLTTTLLLFTLIGAAQELTQSIRGRIVDADSEFPAIGATVIVVGSSPFIGSATDIDGYFKLEDVPIGRVTIEISYIGYEKKVMPNLVVNSAKEVFLNIALTESVNQLEEFAIVAHTKKDEPLNEMAIISSRQFSTEDAKQYAGTLGDPARMAGNFAGASNSADGSNDIIVRGNSPRGILWQMDGVEIPNPNHFAGEGASGGPINALNSSMLANSEFHTAAFAPEYGNATSGVFDVKLRQGNNEKREYSFGMGLLGTDFTVEGPFKKGGKASYLANYRYSTLSILDEAGLVDFGGGIPKYQDAAFNFHLPTKKAGIFKVFGFGGISSINAEETFSEENDSIIRKVTNKNHVAFGAVGHSYIFDKNTYLKSNVSMSSTGTDIDIENRINDIDYLLDQRAVMAKYTIKTATTLHKKLNAKNKISAGIIYTSLNYDMNYKNRVLANDFDQITDVKESSSYQQMHGTWKHRFNDKLTAVSGVHVLAFSLNNNYSIEPRLGLSYKVKGNQTLSAGFGMHSKIESLLDYTTKITDDNGVTTEPNRDLKLPKANHYVLGYDIQFSENAHFKTELYYQDLYDIAVENDVTSNYSTVNQKQWSTDKELVSEGVGRNYGIELTLERYFSKGFYYLATASIFESQYKTLAGSWVDSRYNGNFNANFLIGKEFKVGSPKKNKTLMISLKGGFQGGNRYNAIDLEASKLSGEEELVGDNYSEKGDDIFFLNFSTAYKVNRKKTTHELKFDLLNASGNDSKVSEYYDDNKQSIESVRQWPPLPNLKYTINF